MHSCYAAEHPGRGCVSYLELLPRRAVGPAELCRGRLDRICCIEIVGEWPLLALATWIVQTVLHYVLQLCEYASTSAAGRYLETRKRWESLPVVSRVGRLQLLHYALAGRRWRWRWWSWRRRRRAVLVAGSASCVHPAVGPHSRRAGSAR